MRFTHLIAPAFAIVALSAPAAAQEDAKAAFQARYAELRSAMESQDAAKVGALITPDYQMTDVNGQVRDFAAVMERMNKMRQAGGGGAQRTSNTTVISATIAGDVATVEQKLEAGGKRMGDDGEEHTMEMIVLSTDTWVKKGDAWLLRKSDQKDMTIKRDGEEFIHQAK